MTLLYKKTVLAYFLSIEFYFYPIDCQGTKKINLVQKRESFISDQFSLGNECTQSCLRVKLELFRLFFFLFSGRYVFIAGAVIEQAL